MLTHMQIAFCNYYAAGNSVTEAAEKAGYKQGCKQGNKLLRDERIIEYIDKLNKKVNQEKILSIEQIQTQLSQIAMGEIPENRLDKKGNVIECPSSLTVRLKALELLGRSKGMFIDKIETNTPLQIKVEVD